MTRFQNIHLADRSLFLQYRELFKTDITEAQEILEDSQLSTKLFRAENVNGITESISNTEEYYYNNIPLKLEQLLTQYNIDVQALEYKGDYSSSENYYSNNIVSYNNELYYCKIASGSFITNVPPTDTSSWVELALRGEKGSSGLGVNLKGNWSSSESYSAKDVVGHNNYLWVAISNNSNQEPTTSSSVWIKFLDYEKRKIELDSDSANVGDIYLDIINQKDCLIKNKKENGSDTLYPLDIGQIHFARNVSNVGNTYNILIDFPAAKITKPILISFIPNVSNRENCTVSINGLAAVPIYFNKNRIGANIIGTQNICLLEYSPNNKAEIISITGDSRQDSYLNCVDKYNISDDYGQQYKEYSYNSSYVAKFFNTSNVYFRDCANIGDYIFSVGVRNSYGNNNLYVSLSHYDKVDGNITIDIEQDVGIEVSSYEAYCEVINDNSVLVSYINGNDKQIYLIYIGIDFENKIFHWVSGSALNTGLFGNHHYPKFANMGNNLFLIWANRSNDADKSSGFCLYELHFTQSYELIAELKGTYRGTTSTFPNMSELEYLGKLIPINNSSYFCVYTSLSTSGSTFFHVRKINIGEDYSFSHQDIIRENITRNESNWFAACLANGNLLFSYVNSNKKTVLNLLDSSTNNILQSLVIGEKIGTNYTTGSYPGDIIYNGGYYWGLFINDTVENNYLYKMEIGDNSFQIISKEAFGESGMQGHQIYLFNENYIIYNREYYMPASGSMVTKYARSSSFQYVINLDLGISEYYEGMKVFLETPSGVSGTCYLNINNLGSKLINTNVMSEQKYELIYKNGNFFPLYSYGTEDLISGTSYLPSGCIYFVYE